MLSDRKSHLSYLLPCILILLFYNWQSYHFQIHDFANYYFGAKAILVGSFEPKLYDALYFNQLFSDSGVDKLFINYYPNTPFISVAFLPLTIFEWQEAKLIHNILGSLLFTLSLFRLINFYKLPKWSMIVIPFLFIVAIKNNILFGQTYFYIFFLLAEGLLMYEKNNKTLASIFWSLAILIKVFPIVLFLWLFFKKDMYTLIKMLAVSCLLMVLTIPLIGYNSLLYFITDVFPSSSAGLIYDGFTVRAKSAIMLFKNTFVEDSLLNPSPLIKSTFLFLFSSIIYKGIIFSTAASATISKNKTLFYTFSIWMIASLLVGPTSSSYSKLLLIFPILFYFSLGAFPKKINGIFVLGMTAFLVTFPTQYLYDLPLPFNFLKVFILLGIFIWFLLILGFNWSWIVTIGFLLLFTVQSVVKTENSEHYSYLQHDQKLPLIISDLEFRNGLLNYKYWGIQGETVSSINFKPSEYSTENLEIIDNQIFLDNVQLTNTHDNKRSPILIDKTFVIFLSDQDRAPGCYTIRKLNI